MDKPFDTEVLPAHTPELFQAAVARAAANLRQGGLVALPTETVYGLAANALDPAAVSAIFHAKGRPSYNPIIVHVSGVEMARRCVAEWPGVAERLAETFWPGPLTLVLRCSSLVPEVVTAGGHTVGLRKPAHPIIQAVIQACGFPLAAPSANLSNRLSPTNAGHVLNQLQGRIPLIIDGGQCQVGVESTVLDLSTGMPRILRPGMIHEGALTPITGPLSQPGSGEGEHLKSPGMLPKHYAPRAALRVLGWTDELELSHRVTEMKAAPDRTAVLAHTRIPQAGSFKRISILPRDPEAYARGLYLALHECDASGVELILVEFPPEGPDWRAIRDRLSRAATR